MSLLLHRVTGIGTIGIDTSLMLVQHALVVIEMNVQAQGQCSVAVWLHSNVYIVA